MSATANLDFLSLSVSERILLVEDIWDSIAETPEAVELTPEQRAELDRRLDAYHLDVGGGSPWQEALGRIRDRT